MNPSCDQSDFFTLHDDSLSLLDQIFMPDDWPIHWDDLLATAPFEEPMLGATESSLDMAHTTTTQDAMECAQLLNVTDASLSQFSVDAGMLLTAMQAYFEFAVLALPVILPEAFWTDVRSSVCSPCLTAAVACRGVPFTDVDEKWNVQQQLARIFRAKFLEARACSPESSSVRLDELEALALMAGFEYEATSEDLLHMNLAKLFLTHDSLVLMTLRFDDNGSSDRQHSPALSRLAERRVLLYWHVYAVDAFHCLDHQHTSRILEADETDSGPILHHEAKNYFDAILALAAIARNITKTLSSAKVKHHGIRPSDVRSLYGQIDIWKSGARVQHLPRPTSDVVAVPESCYSSSTSPDTIRLHRAVLCALEVNCILAIERYVSTYRLQPAEHLKDEQTALEVEHRSVRAVSDMSDLVTLASKHELEAWCFPSRGHTTADLVPVILRNISAGCCYWICQRGIDLSVQHQISSATHTYAQKSLSGATNYQAIAQLLKDYAATAVSHQDTAQVLERLEAQIGRLNVLLS